MAMQASSFLGIVLLLLAGLTLRSSKALTPSTPTYDTSFLNRSSFPAGFIFGTGSASYQYEGAAKEGGRGPSIWDTYTHEHPERIKDGSNGDVANDQYHHYKEDVGIMKNMNLDAYRFSISWSRVLPNGKLSGGVNKEGIKYYNNLINELLRNGLKPFVTLFHWDLPQTLEDEYGGFLSPQIINHFQDYVELCYKEFGDRVKHWVTMNQPWTYANGGYASGTKAPGRCSAWQKLNCTGGDSSTEPYLVGHHLLLSHAAAVKLYKQKYQASQKGVIGVTLVSHWYIPISEAKHHKNAALRSLDFMLGWFLDPLTSGDYPHSVRSFVGNRLPKFTKEQSKLLIGSFDFLGLNYYTTYYASYAPQNNSVKASCLTDARATQLTQRNGVPIGPQAASSWLFVYPRGIRDLLLYIKTKYNNPLIYITENGIDEFNDPKLTLEKALFDPHRVDYYFRHLYYLQKAIKHMHTHQEMHGGAGKLCLEDMMKEYSLDIKMIPGYLDSVEILVLDPNDEDILYLYIGEDIVRYDIQTREWLKLAENIPNQNCFLFPIVLPWWPTPVPRLPQHVRPTCGKKSLSSGWNLTF